MSHRFHVGLDLGQANDYTAVAVVEEAGDDLHVRHLERFRHTLYPDVADRVEALLDSPQLKGKANLVIDATGVGPAVTDIFSKRGVFYEEWAEGEGWERYTVSAEECPRIPPEFLEEERRTLGPWWFAQEYECRFMDTVDQVFATEVIDKAITDEVAPLFGGAA